MEGEDISNISPSPFISILLLLVHVAKGNDNGRDTIGQKANQEFMNICCLKVFW